MTKRKVLAAPPIALLVLTLGGGSLASADDEEIHACRDADGNVVYQSDPCPEPPPTAPSAPSHPAATPVRPPAPAQPERPGPGARKSGAARRDVRPEPVKTRTKPRQSFVLVPPSLRSGQSDPGRAHPTEPAAGVTAQLDPRFASPEKTWQTFRTAVGVNDRETARQCLAPSAVETLGPQIDSPGTGGVAWVVDDTARVQAEGEAGPYWSLRVWRAHERPRWVFLVRTDSGEWKIVAL